MFTPVTPLAPLAPLAPQAPLTPPLATLAPPDADCQWQHGRWQAAFRVPILISWWFEQGQDYNKLEGGVYWGGWGSAALEGRLVGRQEGRLEGRNCEYEG